MRAQLAIFRDDGTTHLVDLDDEQVEWLLNSLRLMQEKQQELSTKHHDEKLTKQNIVDALNASSDLGKSRDWQTPDGDAEVDLGEFFREQFTDVTNLRESIVIAVGYDMTEG